MRSRKTTNCKPTNLDLVWLGLHVALSLHKKKHQLKRKNNFGLIRQEAVPNLKTKVTYMRLQYTSTPAKSLCLVCKVKSGLKLLALTTCIALASSSDQSFASRLLKTKGTLKVESLIDHILVDEKDSSKLYTKATQVKAV